MSSNGHRRSDLVILAMAAEIQRRRDQIDCDPSVKRIIVTLHLSAGGGHPRSIECTVQHEERLLDSCGMIEKILDKPYGVR